MNPEVMKRRDEWVEYIIDDARKCCDDCANKASNASLFLQQGFDAGFTDKDSAGPIISELVDCLQRYANLNAFWGNGTIGNWAQEALEKYKAWESKK